MSRSPVSENACFMRLVIARGRFQLERWTGASRTSRAHDAGIRTLVCMKAAHRIAPHTQERGYA
jgi:hypothetical protein